MEDEIIIDDTTDVEQYEAVLFESQRQELLKRIGELDLEIQYYKEYENKLCAAASKITGQRVDKYNIDEISLTNATWGMIMDAALEKQDDLIRPSHEFLKYSFINKQPDLQKYIPVKRTASALQILNDQSTSRALEIVKEYTSENTRLANIGDLIYWQAWLSAIGFTFNEQITEKEVITFIIQHAEGLDRSVDEKLIDQGYKQKLGPHKLSTIKRRIASLSVFLDNARWNNPCRNKSIKTILQKLTKKYGGSKPAGKAITKDILDDMLETCGEKLLDLRDKALLLFAWGSGGRRRAEVTAADMKNLIKTPEGNFTYLIPNSKTDQQGNGYTVPVKGRVAKALNDWLLASGVTEGIIFRTVAKGSKLRGALSDTDVYRIVKRRLKIAGYDETQFGAHGLRSGFVTEAGRKGKPLGDVMAMTTHRNVATCLRYYQSGNIINNAASNLAD